MFISGKKTVDMKYINIRIYLIYIDTGCNMEIYLQVQHGLVEPNPTFVKHVKHFKNFGEHIFDREISENFRENADLKTWSNLSLRIIM